MERLVWNAYCFVVSKNLHRRHLNESQRAVIAARIANIPKGRPSKNTPIGAFSEPKAAKLFNVMECLFCGAWNTYFVECGMPSMECMPCLHGTWNA